MSSIQNLPPNSHLIIVWNKGRQILNEVDTYLNSNFSVFFRIEVKWSDDLAHKNMSRFYGKKLPDIAKKVEHCGIGPFVVYIINDTTPNWALEMTTSGVQRVNRNIFDIKKMFRQKLGGGHRIHATNNLAETVRDVALLFGPDLPTTAESPIIQMDLIGAHGWKSLDEVFLILNYCTPYVLLRNFEKLPYHFESHEHGDIDLLCNDHIEVRQLLNAHPVFEQKYRRYHMIQVGDREIPFDIRDVKEGYYCNSWSHDLIARRNLSRGIFIPDHNDHLYSLAYHALVHKRVIAPDYMTRLLEIFKEDDTRNPVSADFGYLLLKLKSFMRKKGYKFVRPRDWSVFFNYTNIPEVSFPYRPFLTDPPRTYKHLKRELKAYRRAHSKK